MARIKRWSWFTILALVIAGGLFRPFSALAVDSADGRFYCSILDNGAVAIEDYYGSESNLVIPATILLEDGSSRMVRAIEWYSFDDSITLQSVSIPNTVTKIGNGAFMGCISLQQISIPDSVVMLGNWVFDDCTSLRSARIGNGVTALNSSLFSECTSLSSVKFGSRVTAIGYGVFRGCTSLRSITLPDSVNAIAAYAFDDTTSVRIPAKATVSKLAPSKARMKVTWRKKTSSKVSGFEISCKRSGKKAKTYSAGKTAKSKTISKLTRGKKYSFKVRSYRSISGKRYYGTWSAVKSAKTK